MSVLFRRRGQGKKITLLRLTPKWYFPCDDLELQQTRDGILESVSKYQVD